MNPHNEHLNLRDTKLAHMPALGFGTWKIKGDDCLAATRTAIEAGYRHIDTAQAYENEAEVGQALADCGLPREQLFVTTKVSRANINVGNVAPSVEASLRKLQMEQVDLLLLHWPDPAVDLGTTLEALQGVLQRGLTKHIGVSNYPVALLREAVETHGAPIACNQVEYHPLLKQEAVLTYCRSRQIAVTAYSPLAQGQLTDHPKLAEIGLRHGKSASQVALRWLIEQDGVAAIPKSATEQNIRSNYNIWDFALSDTDKATIDALGSPQGRTINPGFAPEWDAA